MKSYQQAVMHCASEAIKHAFNTYMSGSMLFSYPSITMEINLISYIYGVDAEDVKDAVITNIAKKEIDLKKNWKQAIKGNYKF